MSATCDHFKNTVVLVATIEVKHDKHMIAKFRRTLLAVKESALSKNEPGTLEYRVSQANNIFNVWAKFSDAQAVLAHTQTSAYWDLHMGNDLLIQEPTVLFFEEL